MKLLYVYYIYMCISVVMTTQLGLINNILFSYNLYCIICIIIMWWGYSSTLDLLSEYVINDKSSCCSDETLQEECKKELNMLLVGQSDNRHVLKTLSKKFKHEDDVQINLYICEPLLENIARDLLFLFLALEESESVGLAEKTRFFMELYGNSLIRPSTSNYLAKTAQHLLNMVTDFDYAAKIMPMVSLNQLKYKERDQLEIIFKYWACKNENFDILKSWDDRVRNSLGLRYDSKCGVFDWDYHMRYRCYGAENLNIQEYKRFRERGISFHSEDTDPCIPNRTLASAILTSGSKITNCGYLGDIETGPYPAFGFDCEDPKMLEKVNGYAKKSATDITEYNIMRLFYEITNKKDFNLADSQDDTYTIFAEDSSSKLQIKYLPADDAISRRSLKPFDCKLQKIENFKIIFLPTTALNDCLNKDKYANIFDVVTFPQVMVLKCFTPSLVKLFKKNCKIIVDTPKYLLNYRKEDLEKYKVNLENLMKESNCENLTASFSFNSDEFMRFIVKK